MAARKLQAEIDRTLKKVSEGVELFDSIYEKMQSSTNPTQKEKLELDLKTQIKKLQRLRDQIKTWVASNEIKDKSSLVDNRKLIETQMEKFKACEKEMKTKAYSKEGLLNQNKLDPQMREKVEMTSWVSKMVDELSRQVELSEAEVENLQGGDKKKKSKGSGPSRLEELESLNERRKWHINRLEIVLRLLENGTLSPDRVGALKEDIAYFVETNTEEDFEEDEHIYDELNLDDAEEFRTGGDELGSDDESESGIEDDGLPPRTPLKDPMKAKSPSYDEDSSSPSKAEQSPVLRKPQVRKPSQSHEPGKIPFQLPAGIPPTPNFTAQPMSQAVKAGLPTPSVSKPPTLPPIRYAAAVANSTHAAATTPLSAVSLSQQQPPSATASQPPTSVPPAQPSTASSNSNSNQSASGFAEANMGGTSSPSAISSPVASSIAPMTAPEESVGGDGSYFDGVDGSRQQSPVLSSVGVGAASVASPQPPYSTASVAASSPYIPQSNAEPPQYFTGAVQQQPQQQQQQQAPSIPQTQSAVQQPQPPMQQQPIPQPSPLPQQVQRFSSANPATATATGIPPSSAAPSASGSSPLRPQPQPQAQQLRGQQAGQLPNSLSDLVASFEGAKLKAAHRMNNLDQVQSVLEAGFKGIPQPHDTEKPKYYIPRNPYPTPPHYPQAPLGVLSTAGLFGQLDVETLFYVFYYLPGTYQQYLAAQELKKQSWRFHVKYLTWFQRHSEPQAITDEYEQGVYVYFDWEGSWCQRKKSDFRFEYRYLSED